MRALWKISIVIFLLVVSCFHKQIREGFVNTMNLTLSQMVSNKGLEIPEQTLPYNAICAKVKTGKGQCKPPYKCQSPSDTQYGNCL